MKLSEAFKAQHDAIASGGFRWVPRQPTRANQACLVRRHVPTNYQWGLDYVIAGPALDSGLLSGKVEVYLRQAISQVTGVEPAGVSWDWNDSLNPEDVDIVLAVLERAEKLADMDGK